MQTIFLLIKTGKSQNASLKQQITIIKTNKKILTLCQFYILTKIIC